MNDTPTGGTIERRTTGLPGRSERSSAPVDVPCQICGATTVPGLDLGHQPVGDLVVSQAELNQPETFYPLRLQHCLGCGLTQLSYIVDPAVVYKNFPFVSGTTQTATRHLQSLPDQLVSALGLDGDSFAVDIGSNDGTLLKAYIPHGVKFIGVDPAGDPAQIANDQGIPTLHAFFNEETVAGVIKEQGQAQAVTACGVFAHIADLDGVMKGVKDVLAPGGIFATDSQYWLDMVLTHHYDNMFHQHLRYYSLKPLIHLFRQYDMDVYDVERSGVYGGSIRVFSCHAGDHPISSRVTELQQLEEDEGLYDPATYERFAQEIDERRRRLFSQVYELASQGKRVVGFGAPAKASTVCNYTGLGRDLLEYITEVNPLRIGMHLPGVHVPILEEETMFDPARAPDAGILFAWNYYDEIVPKLRERGFEGEIIEP